MTQKIELPSIKKNDIPDKYIIYDNDPICDLLDELEDHIDYAEYLTDDSATLDADGLPKVKPILIDGTLRTGHKMLLSAASKAGKTTLLLELAIALSTGGKWLEMNCKKCKVLFLNMEKDAESCNRSVVEIARAYGIDYRTNKDCKQLEDLTIMHLRGKSLTMEDLAKWFLNYCQPKDYDAIIIDPLYKLLDGDENSAADMKKICGHIDAIAEYMQAAIIYDHHHSKGAQGRKQAIDRFSGSGVFARDPDAILDLIEVDPTTCGEDPDGQIPLPDGASAWRLSFTLREFPERAPIEILFHYPTHEVIKGLETARMMVSAEVKGNRQKALAARKERKNKRLDRLTAFIESYITDHGEQPTTDTIIDHFNGKRGFSLPTIYRMAAGEDAPFEIRDGKIFIKSK